LSEQKELLNFAQGEQRSNEWEKKTFSEVIEVNNYPPLEKGKEQTYVAMGDLNEFERKIKETNKKEYKYSAPRFKNGDTLFPKMSRCLELGKTAYVDVLDKNEIAFGSTEFFVMRPKNEEVLPKFVYYTLRREDIRQHALSWATGSTARRQRISTDFFDNLSINLPPIEEQKEIVKFLDAIDTKIEVNKYINELLEEIAQTLYQSWFTDFEPYDEFKNSELGSIPVEFEVKPISEFADIILGSSPKSKYYNEEGEGLPFFQGSKNFGLRYPEIERWCTKKVKVAKEEDVLISVRAPVGDVNKAMKECVVGRGVTALRMKEHTNEFLYHLLKANKQNWEKYKSGTTFNSINKSDIQNFPVSLPPKKDIKEFNTIVRPMGERFNNNFIENDKLADLRDTLLPRLVSGEIRLNSDINNE